jgi:hypothetical protein
MTITFENDNDVIVYALEKIISFARKSQYIFIAQCVWWLASVIGLDQALIIHIDNLRKREELATQRINTERLISPIPRDLAEDQRLDQVLRSAEECLARSERDRNSRLLNRVNPLPQTKTQLKKARKIKRLQEAKNQEEVKRNQRLSDIRDSVIKNLSRE